MTIDYRFIGWCKDGTSDKVWGYIELGAKNGSYGDYVTFWGRRGRALQTKIHRDAHYWDLVKLSLAKERKGYIEVDQNKLNEVYPEFQEDLEKTTIWAILKV